jgi:L-2-hydroxyglutarate oxidase LhgO
MMESLECAVIGAGVVGLAIARALALQGREVVILESADAIGTVTSARNSEVIHGGIYYPKDSLKARFCVAGRKMLYDFCAEHGVQAHSCGKLIVACNADDLIELDKILEHALANGVHDIRKLNKADTLAMEPELNAVGSLLSPSTGIVDSHGFMLAMQGDAEDGGAMLAFNAPVVGGSVNGNGILLCVGGEAPMEIDCRFVINSAGLAAQRVASVIDGMPADQIVPGFMARGCYFSLSQPVPFTHLIYPVPHEAAGLGVHLTLDLGGQARFGPDVEWIEEENYEVDPRRADVFYDAVRRYWPDLRDDSLNPDYSGIRPTVHKPGMPRGDFILQGSDVHGVKGLVNLYGIESPGLTSSLAIGEAVAEMVEREF